MKKLRLLPVFALLFAIMLTAFTSQPKSDGVNSPRWYYTLSDDSGYEEPSSFVPLDEQDAGCSESVGIICVIEAEEGEPGQPDLSDFDIVSYKP